MELANGNKALADHVRFVDSIPPQYQSKVKLKCEHCGKETVGEITGPVPRPEEAIEAALSVIITIRLRTAQ